jgi:lipopolysaccharide biosynthesis glycosyltransferase
VDEENLARLSEMLKKYPSVPVAFYAFDATAYSHFRLDDHITLASYFRLFLTEILPPDVNRLIYLDSDVVVLDDLQSLWDVDLGDKLIAAVPDLFMPENARLDLPDDYCYFNAGVLLIDLASWRARDFVKIFVNYVETKSAILKFHDQDTLNFVLQDSVKYLDVIWNYQPRSKPDDGAQIGVTREQYLEIQKSPKIVHFTSQLKPWFYRFDVGFEDQYNYYLRQTPWKNYVPPDRTLKTIIWRFAKRRLPRAANAFKSVFNRPAKTSTATLSEE